MKHLQFFFTNYKIVTDISDILWLLWKRHTIGSFLIIKPAATSTINSFRLSPTYSLFHNGRLQSFTGTEPRWGGNTSSRSGYDTKHRGLLTTQLYGKSHDEWFLLKLLYYTYTVYTYIYYTCMCRRELELIRFWYLKGRQQSVKIGITKNGWLELGTGVSQDSIRGPLLLNVFNKWFVLLPWPFLWSV